MSFFQNLFGKKTSKEDGFVKAISVSMYADRKKHTKELECALELIEQHTGQDRKYTEFLFKKVEKTLEKYERNFEVFLNDKTFIVREVLENGQWDLGVIIEKIIQSDGVVTSEENELLNRVIECVRAREAALISLKKIYKEINDEKE